MQPMCLLDTNILLRMVDPSANDHALVRASLIALNNRMTTPCYTSQCLGEFWNVATRPADRNGFGLSTSEVQKLASKIESRCLLLPDSEATHRKWRELIVLHHVTGIQVHDARIAATMYVNGVRQILTFNARDFKRFPLLEILDPAEARRR